MIDVLLVSPRLPPTDPRRSGDNAYTDLLLQYPPAGVQFHHYEDLIRDGQMHRLRVWQTVAYHLVQRGVLPPDLWAEYLSSNFTPDLVHVVAFAATIRLPKGSRVPTILHASSPSITDLTVKRRWTSRQVARAYRRKRAFLRAARTYHYALNPMDACKILVQSAFGLDLLLSYGQVKRQDSAVLYPAQPPAAGAASTERLGRRPSSAPVTFLFVGTDFERKNGPLVVEAFRQVHLEQPDTRLLLVGRPADGQAIVSDGIVHRLFVPHDELVHEVFPQADMFLLPTQAEGSFAFTLFEAMSMGIPAITTNLWAMPEIIEQGQNGFLIAPNSLEELISSMRLVASQSELLRRMQRCSLDTFHARFSIQAHNTRLRDIYDEVLERTF